MAYEISIKESGYIVIDDESVNFLRTLSDGRSLYDVFNDGAPFSAEAQALLPTEAKVSNKVRLIPDIVSLPGSNWAVSQKLRDIIDSFDSIRVEFFPLMLRRQNVEEMSQYYIVNIFERFDALIVDQSTVSWSATKTPSFTVEALIMRGRRPEEKRQKLTMSAPRLIGKHLWRADNLLTEKIFCSNEFYKNLHIKKITGFWFEYVDEINEEWDELQNYGNCNWLMRGARIVEDRRQ